VATGKRTMTLARVRSRMRLLQRSITSLTRKQLKRGKAVSYGTFADPGPNTNQLRFPNPFTGGN
jgi:hypothetical protein